MKQTMCKTTLAAGAAMQDCAGRAVCTQLVVSLTWQPEL